jgi:hypothetical protein
MQHENQQADQLDIIWGAKAIGEFIGLNEREVCYQADRSLLPVKRQGRLLVASRRKLREHFELAATA